MMGREHLINLHHLRSEGVAVVAIADPHLPSQQEAEKLAHSFDWPLQVFSSHKELLDSGLCDVLVVSTPNMTHFEILMDIISHPKPHHVLVEKPLCTTVADCRKVPDIIDNAYVIVEFENGSRGMLDLCMFAEGSKNEQEISVVGDIGKGEAFVPESTVRWGTRVEGRDGVKTLKAKDDRIKYDGLHHGSSYLEHLQFLSAVRAEGAQAPAVDLHDGLISVAIGVAAQLSIEKGQFVTIEEVMN
ncbi:UNVERIFIED_CONTAM: hypothetical protein Sradi_5698600 [Sesamum radiatum]|uniref:Gfo/Idh/MocA-like oxidoreductase N-terminal domain-containing protein n=1 Tax=Sesamum radiatum TaxID=300843 RepID=A0AAW2L2B2_SESRA